MSCHANSQQLERKRDVVYFMSSPLLSPLHQAHAPGKKCRSIAKKDSPEQHLLQLSSEQLEACTPRLKENIMQTLAVREHMPWRHERQAKRGPKILATRNK